MPVDLFRRVIIKGTQQGLNLSAGSALVSEADTLIHTLEQRETATARTISQNEATQTTGILMIDDGAFWALSSVMDMPFLTATIAGLTATSGTEKNGQFWAETSLGGISFMGS